MPAILYRILLIKSVTIVNRESLKSNQKNTGVSFEIPLITDKFVISISP